MTREKELAELYNKIIEAEGYVADLFSFLYDVVYGRCQQNADLFDSLCKTEKLMISDSKANTFNLLKVLTMYKNLIESKQ